VGKHLAVNVTWTFVGNLASQAITFLGFVLVARTLGRSTYGQFALVYNAILATSTVAALGLGVTATKYVSQYITTDHAKLSRILRLCSVVSILSALTFTALLLLLAPILAKSFFRASGLTDEFRLAGAYLFFQTFNGFQVGALSGLQAFRSLAFLGLGSSATLVTMLYWCTALFGLRGAVFGLGLSGCIISGAYHIVLRREMRRRGMLHQRGELLDGTGSVILNFSLPATVSGIMGSAAIWYCNALLSRQPNGFSEIALFSAANTLRLIVLFVPGILNRVSSPLLNELAASCRPGLYRATFFFNLAGAVTVAALTAVLLSALRPYVLALFGKDFVDPHQVTLILLVSAVVEVAATCLYQSVFVRSTLWPQVAVNFSWAVCLIGAAERLKDLGAAGLAWAYLLAWICGAAFYFCLLLLPRVRRQAGYSEGLAT
jgi:O-antigen/teichoic acid export membrane protein